MPTHRRSRVIARTLQTVLNQTFHDMEILIREDGEDGTEAVIRAIGDPRIRFHRNPTPLGMPGNLNRLIEDTRGEYVLVLHDHDRFDPTLIEKMVHVLDRHRNVTYVHSALEVHDEESGAIRRYVADFPPITSGEKWLRHMLSRFDCAVCAMSMVRRSTYEQYGLYDPDFGFISDVEMWMRLALHGDVAYLREPLMFLAVREAGHPYRAGAWKLLESVFRIHRLYGERSGIGASPLWRIRFGLRKEAMRVKNLLSALRRSRYSKEAREEAGEYLRHHGGPCSRVAGRLLMPW